MNESDAWVIALMHKPTDSEIVREAFSQSSNFQHLQHFFWYQEDQTSPTPVSSYTNSVQMGTIAFMPERTKVTWNVNKDPRMRHNFISCKAVSTLHRNEEGEVINPCQKPPEIIQWLCANHCAPGSNVLVLGAGAGGEVLGAAASCCNVVAVESDGEQFSALRRILVLKMTSQLTALQKEDPDPTTPSSINTTTTHTTQSPSRSENTQPDRHTSTEAVVTCLDCLGEISREGLDVQRQCSRCTVKGPLHQNCCVELNGEIVCTRCQEKLQSVTSTPERQD